jgi:hypothetical protein
MQAAIIAPAGKASAARKNVRREGNGNGEDNGAGNGRVIFGLLTKQTVLHSFDGKAISLSYITKLHDKAT